MLWAPTLPAHLATAASAGVVALHPEVPQPTLDAPRVVPPPMQRSRSGMNPVVKRRLRAGILSVMALALLAAGGVVG